MRNADHSEILQLIREHSGKPTQHTFLDSYLGNDHPRYPISAPMLRKIAKEWMRDHPGLNAENFAKLLTSLAKGASSTEKCMVGILLDCSSAEQRKFDPDLFDVWLEHLVGWAEVDSVCTGKYPASEVMPQWKKWNPLIIRFSKSKNINKRRASLVIFCSPLRNIQDERLVDLAFTTIDRLKHEKEILITKAISWVLRSMDKLYREKLADYLDNNSETLPKIAVRETRVKLETGVKNRRKVKNEK